MIWQPNASMRAIAVASALLLLTATTHAADITWSETVIDTTDSDTDPGAGLGDLAVSTNGTLVEAVNFQGADVDGSIPDVTVNGVVFKGVEYEFDDLLGVTVSPAAPTNLDAPFDDSFFSFSSGGTSTGGDIDALTRSFSRFSGQAVSDLTLTNLVVAQAYEVQLIASFARLNRTSTLDDGNGAQIVQSTNNPHSFSTGVFTADATTQDISLTISAGSSFLSAYQLRAIPEPTGLALVGGSMLVATAVRRRR